MSDIVIYALAAVGGFVLAWVIYGILIVIQTLRDFRWRKRIARAHEPRPFRCLSPQRCGSDGRTCLHRGCWFGGR